MRFSLPHLVTALCLLSSATVFAESTPYASCQTSDKKITLQIFADADEKFFSIETNGSVQTDVPGHIILKDADGNFEELNEWLAAFEIEREPTERVTVLKAPNNTGLGASMYMITKAYDGSDRGIIIAHPRQSPVLCSAITN